MKQLFLASQCYIAAPSIGAKIPGELKENTVFITTPIKYRVFTELELDWHHKNRRALQENGFICEDYDIIDKSDNDIKRDLNRYDVMYMEGGNPFYLMQEAAKNNFTKYVTTRVESGMIYISESAGSVAAGIDIVANSRPGKSASDYQLDSTAGFKLVNFVIMPHWGMEKKKADYFANKIPQSYNEDFPYVLLTNNQYIEVKDSWYQIVDITKE